ncbi:hypothetical protein P4278_26015 [Bacillus thuringiensis]|uniref:hypothetical protein n=1 Tax=Bacillus cereus TaxID=1396 RepID=UPI002E1D4638|nr:hypothetical protein [Bacillus thuringiensis]MED2783134.1 hypothetical protein [Bacillus thuringiensis]
MEKIYTVNPKKYKELSKTAEKGDCILIINALPIGEQSYKNGDIYTVELIYGTDCYVQENIGENGWVDMNEYIVVKEIH